MYVGTHAIALLLQLNIFLNFSSGLGDFLALASASIVLIQIYPAKVPRNTATTARNLKTSATVNFKRIYQR